jgi:hypothetical protein
VVLLFFFLLVAAGNFALGFALAMHLGHGPHWVDLSGPARIMNDLRAALRGRRRQTSP